MERSQKIVLGVGLAIPVLAVIGIAIAIIIPRATAEPPQYDFVYTTNSYRYRGSTEIWFEVRNGVLIVRERTYGDVPPIPDPANPPEPALPPLYLYDVETNTSKEVLLQDVQAMYLSQAREAPDGYAVERGGNGGGIFPFYFENRNYEQLYLANGAYAVQLDLGSTLAPDYWSFEFLGWVVPKPESVTQ